MISAYLPFSPGLVPSTKPRTSVTVRRLARSGAVVAMMGWVSPSETSSEPGLLEHPTDRGRGTVDYLGDLPQAADQVDALGTDLLEGLCHAFQPASDLWNLVVLEHRDLFCRLHQ